MSSVPATPPSNFGATPARVQAPSAGAVPMPVGQGSTPAIDPIKLLQRSKWWILIAIIVGAVLGVATHLVWMRLYPFYRATALFEVTAPATTFRETVGAVNVNNDEMNRFMATQAATMVGQTVLQAAVEDPRFRTEAPTWSEQFSKGGSFDSATAARELRDFVRAGPIPQTMLIEMSCTYRIPEEATGMLSIIRSKYEEQLRRRGDALRQDRTRAISDQLSRLEQEIQTLQTRRQTLIQTRQLDTIDARISAKQANLQEVERELLDVNQRIEAASKALQQRTAERDNPAGPEYGDDLRERAERDDVVIRIRTAIADLQREQQGMLNQGLGRDNRGYRQLQSRVEGATAQLETSRREVLEKLFQGELEQLRKNVEQLQAQRTELVSKQQTLRTEVVDLTNAQRTVDDLSREIEARQTERIRMQGQQSEIIAITAMETANRVLLHTAERVPDQPAFPRLRVMLPAGVVLCVGLTIAFLFLRELIDQRVKGPGDVTLIPRTRVLGWVPDAGEDPAGAGNAETAFRDRGRGIVAESFRQLRGAVNKRLAAGDVKSILVMSGMPGSGATTIASNLALSLAASEKRVLLIDANFRRPNLHKVMGLQEAPGLADLLAGARDLRQTIQATSTANLDLLSAGTRDARVPEKLSAQAMIKVLADVRDSYDVIILDTAPAVVAGDGLALANKCDASILVVRAMQDKRGLVARIKNELADSRSELLGVVVNAVRSAAGGYMKSNIRAASAYAND